MRKFNFLSFLIGVIAVGGVGAFALTSQYLKSDGTPDFQKLKSTANENRLNAEMRDQLMDGLSKMQAQLPSTHGGTIPAGAVMAFNLSSCPDGWTPFTEANDRFIMGSQGNLREKGGKNNIKLTINQLPPHFFYIAGGSDGSNNGIRDSKELYLSDYVWNDVNGDDNRSYRLAPTHHTPDLGRTNTIGNWNSINIQNPYIKLLYCVKGENIAPTPAPSPAPTPRPTPSPAPEIVPAVTYDGKCSKTIPNRCDRGEATDFRAINSISKDGSHSYRTCKGLNGWKDAFCMHYDPLLRVNDRDEGIR